MSALFKYSINLVLFSMGILISGGLFSQSLMTPEEAINIALENNFGIMVARNNADIVRINNTMGAAGMTPTISANGAYNFSQSKVEIENQNGSESYDLQTTSEYAGVYLDWVLFDGGKMFITKKKLSEIEYLGGMRLEDTIQQTVYNVVAAYYNIVRQKQQLASIIEAMNYGEEQVKILQTSFNAGLIAKSSLLQAKIDLNVYKENAINQQYNIITSKRALNQVLSRSTDIPFEVIDTISTDYMPNKEELLQKLYEQNVSLLSSQKQIDIAQLSLREYAATRLPKISFSAGYDLSLVDNSAGNVLSNQSYGPAIGASISIPIYQSGSINRQVKTSRLQVESANYIYEKIKLQVSTQLQDALTQYENQQQLLAIEKENELMAKENLDIAIERLRLGQANSLEVRQAQESYVLSLTRRITFEYNLKIAETKLKQLVAEL
jgi:outer membrane protein